MSPSRSFFAAAFLAAAAVPALQGQVTTPHPLLNTISPPAAQSGTTVEVSISGADLDGASRLHFSVPGITSAPKFDDKQKPVANKFTVTVPAGTPAGLCDVRAVARYGISNPRRFAVSSLPVVAMPATALSADKAFQAEPNTVLAGAAVKQGASFARISLKKGQRLITVCRPLSLDSRMDAVVNLRNADGTRLARLQPDGLLDFTAPADGSFLIEVHDLMYRGDAEFPFLLTLTTGPVIERAFDGGAQWTLYGRNLPKGIDIAPPSTPAIQRTQLPADEAKKLLAANPIKAVRFGPEHDSPAAAPQPVALKLPARHTGWFAPRGQARVFTFDAKKGDVFWIEVSAAGKGLPADPFFVIEKGDTFIAEAADRPAAANKTEFDAGWADPSHRFEAKEDGSYRIKLRNLFSNTGPQPFELTVQPASNEFALVAMPAELPKAKNATNVDVASAPLWRGGVAVLKVFALRKSGFSGAIELAADGLPADVKFLGGTIREGQAAGYAAFFAEETAKDWAGAVKLHAKTGGQPARGATALVKVGNTTRESVFTRLTDEAVLGVVGGDAPVTIEAANPVIESDGKGKVTIPLAVKRRGGFADAIKLASLGIDGVTGDIAAKAADGKVEIDVAKLKLAPGDHPLILQAAVKHKHQRLDDPKAAAKDITSLVHSKPVTIRVKAGK